MSKDSEIRGLPQAVCLLKIFVIGGVRVEFCESLRELPRGLAKKEGLDNRDTISSMPRKFYRIMPSWLGLEIRGAGGRKRLISLSIVNDKITVTECLLGRLA